MKKTIIRSLLTIAAFALMSLGAIASAAFDPISAKIEITPTTLTGSSVVKVSIQVNNVGDDDMPGAVTLLDPSGARVSGFGSGGSITLALQKSYAWTGEWYVTQDQLDAGAITYKLSYPYYDDSGNLTTHSKNVTAKLTYNKTTSVKVNLARRIYPESPQVGTEVTIDYTITNNSAIPITNINLSDTAIGLDKGVIAVDSLAPGAQITKSYTFTVGEKAVKSAPTYSFIYDNNGKPTEASKTAEAATITPIKINLTATLTASKSLVNNGDKVDLVCEIKNSGSVSYKNIKITEMSIGEIASGISIKANKSYKETKTVVVDGSTDYQFIITGEDSSGNTITVQTTQVRVNTREDAKPINLGISIVSDRDVVYKEPFTAIFVITVTNNGDEPVKEIVVSEAGKSIYTIPELQAGEESVIAKEFTLNMGGKFQFAASAKNSVEDTQKFESNIAEIVYQAPKPTPSPTPTLTPTPTAEPTPEPSDDTSTSGGGTAGSQSSGGGFGNVLRNILLGLLAVIVMGIGAMLMLDRTRSAAEPARAATVSAYDHLDRSERRDYTRLTQKQPRAKTAAKTSTFAALTAFAAKPKKKQTKPVAVTSDESYDDGDYAYDESQFAPPTSDIDSFEGEEWTQSITRDEPDIPRFADPEDSHLIPDDEYSPASQSTDRHSADDYYTEPVAPPPEPPRVKPTARARQTRVDSEIGELGASSGLHHLTKKAGSLHEDDAPITVQSAEDPVSFARKQRAKRGREINLAQFYTDDEE